MSRRKQSNPKPLNKGDCSDTTEEMTVDSRDSKDLGSHELSEEKEQQHDFEELPEEEEEEHPSEENQTSNHSSDQPMETDMEQVEAEDADHEEQQQQQKEADNSTTPPRSPTPQLVPKLERMEQPATPPSAAATPSPPPTPTPITAALPKLRLNALLASDPALKPDAKELNLADARLLAPPPQLSKPEPSSSQSLAEAASSNLVEPLLKPARFMCLPCGIAFSSPSTLEAHQAYYCSHRNKEADEEAGSGDKLSAAGGGGAAGTGNSNNNGGGSSSEPPAKVARTGKQYACTQCSYSADKKVSLNRHMRMHQTSPAPSLPSLAGLTANGVAAVGGVGVGVGGASGVAAGSLEESSSQQIDRYCSDCDIRFNNIKTYRAHKQHYCSSRRNDGQLTPKPEAGVGSGSSGTPGTATPVGAGKLSGAHSPQSRNKTPTPAMVAAAAAAAAAAASLQVTPPQPFLALPTNPIIIVPCSLIRAASLIPGPLTTSTSGIVNPESTCFTLDNGALKPLATALNINALAGNVTPTPPMPSSNQQPIPVLEPERQSASNSEAETKSSPTEPKRKEAGGGATRESTPLDLSLRRSPISALLQRQRLVRSAAALLEAEEALLAAAGKENLESGGSVTPEQIVCAPSLPSSPSMSPSPKRRVVSPRSSGAGSAASMSPPTLGVGVGVPHLLENLPPLRSMLPADFALSESLLAKTNPELALKLAAAAAAAVAGSSTAELASKLGFPTAPGAGSNAPAATAANAPSTQPQIYVKQGVSKCKECNIVFCKYENYLAHKQHYCSARNQESGEGDAKSASSPPSGAAGAQVGSGVGGAASAAETTPVAYQQLICAACGIKYTSLDNLRAHQNYYCPKGGAAATPVADPPQLPKEKCGKCKTLHELGQPCPPPAAPQLPPLAATAATSGASSNSVNKCPVCGVISPTAALARKHMEMHGTVKAFRCSICQYKGNTLRGMRTHIRTHFDKKTSDVNEEHYMTCIFEEDAAAAAAAAAVAATPVGLGLDVPVVASPQEQLEQQQQAQHPPQIFNCDYCNYASSYKGNVLRHMKLLHPHVAINSPSISPETRDQEINPHAEVALVNGDRDCSSVASFHIKSEPLEQPPVAATLSLVHDNNNSPIGTPHTHIKAEPQDMGMDVSPPSLPPPPVSNSPLGNSAAAEAMKKYCSTCDISFNYVKTYLAHKQFYCKSKMHRPEANDSPSPNHMNHLGATVPLQSPSELLLLQKNKENLQEAAI